MHRHLIKIFTFSFLIFFISSCVPAKKYQSLKTDYQELEDQNHTLRKQLAMSAEWERQYGIALNDSLILRYLDLKDRFYDLQDHYRSLETQMASSEKLGDILSDHLEKQFGSFLPEELFVEEENGQVKVTFAERVLFPLGKSSLSQEGEETLSMFANIVKDEKDLFLTIEGHTDSIPVAANNSSYQDNWDLSADRALNVARYLTEEGNINPHRMSAAARGPFDPVATNDTPEGRELNRRIVVILQPDMQDLFDLMIVN